MATVNDVLKQKGSQVFSIGPDASVLDAALLMNEHRIGGLVVLKSAKIAGIITERDVLRRVVAQRADPADVTVKGVMTNDVYVCKKDATTEEARAIFNNQRIRHLPVVDGQGRLEGMISIGDINGWKLSGQEQTIHYLKEYLYGEMSGI
jgi:CBS domain-containing protein